MHLNQAIKNVFVQLTSSLEQLTPGQYIQPSHILYNATIGQHVRHIIELFMELNTGYETGIINYENRKRDYKIETDKAFAATILHEIYSNLDKNDKALILEANYDEDSNKTISVETNYIREVVYNIEHTVHHMALIRVGIGEVSNIILPKSYGVASSTMKYRETCAQ